MSSEENYEEIQIKCVVIGDPGSGKTSLRRKFIGESFDTNYLQTIGSDFSYQVVKHETRNIGLALWDLAGQPQFKSVHSLFYKGAAAIIVVFDVTNEESFLNVPQWVSDFITQTNVNDLPLLIIGNKIDLLDDSQVCIDDTRQNEMVQKLKENSDFKFEISSIRTSAKTGVNVNEGILQFTHKIAEWIENRQSLNGKEIEFEEDPELIFPYFYQVAMNQISGPIIIGSLPKINNEEYQKHKSIVTKLLASFNFEDVTTNVSITGRLEMLEIGAPLIYNAFNIENEDARGSSELYITAFTIDPTYSDTIAGLKGVIDGFLHNSMNKFQKIRIENNFDYITKAYDHQNNPHGDLISQVLFDLREKIHQTIRNWLLSSSN
ncbi:MAG: GTP-binding protein [Candidatus Heimdallarchaeota archaeon]|nr:GTP-binding protein [Candidatus Heimdallarchaeota archaeon]